MLFNTISFLIFSSIVFCLYWLPLGGNKRYVYQNVILVLASLFFYAYWDWRALILFVGSLIFTILCVRFKNKYGLIFAIVVLLFVLGVFKYYNFFISSLNSIFGCNLFTLNLILPIGISFYIFMCISCLVDSYKNKVMISDKYVFLNMFSYLSFFPQIVAGPIGRAPNMLPQVSKQRKFNYNQAMDGLCLIAYGLFKKMVVADLLSLYVNFAFKNYDLYSSITCLIGMVFYTLQIYCDFSGYSDCAIGIGKLFGIELMQNFNRPYLSESFSSFWRNWHISLSTWFRDYVYIPLGGSRCWIGRVIFNTWVVFLLSGLWHGAAWTFVFWGGLHALYLTGGILKKRFLPDALPATGLHLWLKRCVVFLGVAFAWIFFRADTWGVATGYIKRMFAFNFNTSLMSLCAGQGPVTFMFCIIACILLILGDWILIPKHYRIIYIVALISIIVFMGLPTGGEFIYAQF